MKYLKTWIEVKSKGQKNEKAVRRFEIVQTTGDLVKTYKASDDAHYFKMIPVDIVPAVQAIKDLESLAHEVDLETNSGEED